MDYLSQNITSEWEDEYLYNREWQRLFFDCIDYFTHKIQCEKIKQKSGEIVMKKLKQWSNASGCPEKIITDQGHFNAKRI